MACPSPLRITVVSERSYGSFRRAFTVPGNVAVHYQPRTPLFVLDTDALRARLEAPVAGARIALLAHTCGLPAGDVALRIEAPVPAAVRGNRGLLARAAASAGSMCVCLSSTYCRRCSRRRRKT